MLMVNSLVGFGARRVSASAWDPSALFASSEQGVWYDPSDLTTMFQDRAGTTPVTADGQPVGLLLDKSKGLVLGSELVTNGNFSGGDTGWSKGADWSISSGVATLSTSTLNSTLYQAIPGIAVGKVYSVTLDVTSLTAGSIQVGIGVIDWPLAKTISSPGTHTFVAVCGSYADYLRIVNLSESTVECTVDNISVKELPGNHATAPNDAARPLYKVTGLAKWNDFDAVDDVLNTTFPSALGSSCTVAKAVVGGSPTILTAQTIGTTWAESTDNAGVVIVNRALTGQETTDLTAWLTVKGATS